MGRSVGKAVDQADDAVLRFAARLDRLPTRGASSPRRGSRSSAPEGTGLFGRIPGRARHPGLALCLPLALGAACSEDVPDRLWFDCVDRDGDGFWTGMECRAATTDWPVDCDDGRADVFPGAPELCDGVDNACLGRGGAAWPIGNAGS